jgi:hypothetical protein
VHGDVALACFWLQEDEYGEQHDTERVRWRG